MNQLESIESILKDNGPDVPGTPTRRITQVLLLIRHCQLARNRTRNTNRNPPHQKMLDGMRRVHSWFLRYATSLWYQSLFQLIESIK